MATSCPKTRMLSRQRSSGSRILPRGRVRCWRHILMRRWFHPCLRLTLDLILRPLLPARLPRPRRVDLTLRMLLLISMPEWLALRVCKKLFKYFADGDVPRALRPETFYCLYKGCVFFLLFSCFYLVFSRDRCQNVSYPLGERW
jgi:hypothetical protein